MGCEGGYVSHWNWPRRAAAEELFDAIPPSPIADTTALANQLAENFLTVASVGVSPSRPISR